MTRIFVNNYEVNKLAHTPNIVMISSSIGWYSAMHTLMIPVYSWLSSTSLLIFLKWLSKELSTQHLHASIIFYGYGCL